jgi:hypothetical protein
VVADPEELDEDPLDELDDVDVARDAAELWVDGEPDRANAAPAPPKPSKAVRPTVAAARGILRFERWWLTSIG